MATVGFADLRETILPTLWDEDYITKVRLQDGSSFGALVQRLQNGLVAVNRELTVMPHYADLYAATTDVEVEYPIGVSNGFEEATEYSAPDPRRGDTTGHMLPVKPYDRSLGWTMMYLRKARMAKLDADIGSVIIDARNIWQQKLLTRFFSSTANSVGSTSSDVPFADAGSADSTYVPPDSPEGESFTSSHEHFLDYSDTGITQDTIDQSAVDVAVEHLQEHGHDAPFDLIASRTDASSWSNTTNVTGWKAPEWPGIVYHSSAVERAAVPEISRWFGYIETDYGICRVWLTPRVPTGHFGVFKAYGPGDQRNSLRVRYTENVGFGFNVVQGNWVNAPLEMIVAFSEFGVGVGEDRTNGVCVDVAASAYSAPTIS